MSVKVGDIVIFHTRLASLKFNQATEEIAKHPAIVTAVNSDSLLDLTVMYNGSSPGYKNGVWNVEWESSWWKPRE